MRILDKNCAVPSRHTVGSMAVLLCLALLVLPRLQASPQTDSGEILPEAGKDESDLANEQTDRDAQRKDENKGATGIGSDAEREAATALQGLGAEIERDEGGNYHVGGQRLGHLGDPDNHSDRQLGGGLLVRYRFAGGDGELEHVELMLLATAGVLVAQPVDDAIEQGFGPAALVKLLGR